MYISASRGSSKIGAIVEYVKNLTCRLAETVHVPVGIVRIVLAGFLLALFSNSLAVAFGFAVGIAYAIYVHEAIGLRSIATRVIESTIVEALLTAVWTLGGWSWA